MSKWKCEICNSSFENFDARGFDNKIYCPLCYYKKLYKDTELERERLKQAAKDDYENYQEIMAQLSTEKEELQQRNDKAIEYIEAKEKDDDNWIDYELLIEPSVIKEILKGSDKE